jgi:hypothetical protein
MKDVGATMSAVELRKRVDDMVPPLLAGIEQTVDHVRAEAKDPEVRRRALQLKIDAIPVVYRAAFQPDPLAAMLDLWLFLYQMEQCFDAGTGPCELGAHQAAARAAIRAQREVFEREVEKAATNPEALATSRARVQETARRHPLTDEGAIARRRTMTVELARVMGAQSRDAFAVIGDVSMTLTDLTNRLNTYIGDAGRLGRWHAELLLEDLAQRPEVKGSVADLHRVADSADEVAEVLDPSVLDGLLDRPLALIPEERRAVLADIERQRTLTLEYLTGERVAALQAVREERVATMAQLHEERVETMEQVDTLRRQFVEDSVAQAFRVVDHLVWRLAQLLVVLTLLAALLAWLVIRTGRLRFALSAGGSDDEARP